MNSDDDTKLYAIVAKELSINRREEGLWTKAFALENGDERATKARYIRERVDFLKRSRNPGRGQDESTSPDTHAVPEVAHQRKAVPPVGATVQVAPWARFFARTIDLGVVTVLVFVAGVAMEMSLPTWSLGPLQAVLLGFLVFGIALLAYEAIALSEFGTTIGKAAFGLRIRTERGGVLDTASAFRRAFWVWVSGNGCYLAFPTASVFFWWRGYRLLKATGSTPWDKRAGTAVTQGSVGSFRFLAGASVSVALLVGTLLLATLSKQAFKQEFRAATSILDQLHGTPTRRGLSDEEFFGAAPSGRGLSDEEVFGTAAAKQ